MRKKVTGMIAVCILAAALTACGTKDEPAGGDALFYAVYYLQKVKTIADNAFSFFTEFGSSTDVSSVQYEKASSAIVFTVLGTVYSPDSVTGAK